MKKNPMLIGLFVTLAVVAACYLVYELALEKKDSYLITNPTEELIKIKIDDKSYSIAPQQITSVELDGGEHSLSFNYNGKQTDTIINITRFNAVINPTLADYYVFVRPYGAGRNRDSIFTSQTITIDEKIYHGNITHHNGLYIQDFYYNLDQEYPKFFLRKGESTDLSKIFSKEDFKQFYFENYE